MEDKPELIKRLEDIEVTRFGQATEGLYDIQKNDILRNGLGTANSFNEFVYGAHRLAHFNKSGEFEYLGEEAPPHFDVTYNGWHIICNIPYSSYYSTRIFEMLVTIFGEYPKSIVTGYGNTLSYHIDWFKDYPDYDFAKIWLEHVNNGELEFIMSILSDPHFNGTGIPMMIKQQMKIITNSIYGMSSMSSTQMMQSAKHLISGNISDGNENKQYIEQKAFVMREINKRGLDNNNETQMKL